MAMSFPSSPTVGQAYSVSGGPTYTWDGTVWKVLTPGQQYSPQAFTATAGQTTFTISGGYVIGAIDVFRNGVKLVNGQDFTATDLSTVVLSAACSAGDTVEVITLAQILYSQALKNSNNLSDVSNAATALANLNGLSKAGGTMTGAITQVADVGGTVQFLRGRSSDNLAQIGIRNNADNAWIGLLQFAGDGSFIWNSGSGLTQRFSVDPNGLLTLPSGQVKFPAAQNASADANTLDDYEEGTWTPTLSSSGTQPTVTYVSQNGFYTKVGDIVHCRLGINVNITAAGSGYYYVSLPFLSSGAASSNWQHCPTGYRTNVLVSQIGVGFGTTTAALYGSVPDALLTPQTGSITFALNFSYKVA